MWWLGGAIVVAVVALVGGPYVYIHWIEGPAPKPLGLSETSSAGTAAAPVVALDGSWTVADGSQAGYRVKENLFGQDTTAVGRTTSVSGTMTLTSNGDAVTVSAATITVDMTSVTSDQSRRDAQFRGNIMETSTYPDATFTLTTPMTLESTPAVGATVTATMHGTLKLHGASKGVSVEVQARRTGDKIEVSGSIPVLFSDYGIQQPAVPGISVQDNGEVEFLITFAKSA
jgi:polyisoprenoid-binding protein YceI